jgi:ribonuclease HI
MLCHLLSGNSDHHLIHICTGRVDLPPAVALSKLPSTKVTDIRRRAGLEAIHMAVIHAQDLMQTESRIFSDSQPAIKSLAKPKRQSGQAIIEQILHEIDAIYLTTPIYNMQLEWVPGHVGIEGNEKADQAAKSAAIEKINPVSRPTILKSARATEIYQWINGKNTAAHLRNITKRNMPRLRRCKGTSTPFAVQSTRV